MTPRKEWKFSGLGICLTLFISYCSAAQYSISTTWDNQTVNHPPVRMTLERNDISSFKITFDGPFFNDPEQPPSPPNEPFYGLWDYEVAEVFFLNDANQYVEIEVGPYGQYIVLLLNGYRDTIRHSLFIDVSCERNATDWHGTAIIPVDYLPPNVTKMNAYAIHGSGSGRVYESLYPVPFGSAAPDFHKLEAFMPFDRSIILTNDVASLSSVWMDSLEGRRSFTIANTWDGSVLLAEENVQLDISIQNSNMILKVDAPFYNDPAPTASPGPYPSLSNYEVVHFFLLNGENEYLEVQLGPHGHYLPVFRPNWNETTNPGRFLVNYTVSRQNGRWTGTAVIPLTYLPPKVKKCNADATHGNGANRKYNSLYPVPPGSGITQPNYQLTQYFRAIDMSSIYPANENSAYSPVWEEVLQSNFMPSSADTSVPSHLMMSTVLMTGWVAYSMIL